MAGRGQVRPDFFIVFLPVPMTTSFSVIRDATPASAIVKSAVVAMGNFDGVHLGHRVVISAAIDMARKLGKPAYAVTFEPHPRSFFSPNTPQFRLSDEAAKLRLLAGTGLDGAVVMSFDGARAGTTAQDFRPLVAAGIPVVDILDRPVSSSAIRMALAEGQVTEATAMLGAPWFISGEVIHGEKRGRDMGYPTANIRLDKNCGLKHGIYAVRVGIGDKRFDGVASFGRRPTFDNGAPLLEIFLFDFKGDLYGQKLDIAFIGFIRDELKFDGIDALVHQMNDDSTKARAALAVAPDAFPKLGIVTN